MSCPQPTTFMPSVLVNQEYTITGAVASYTFPVFTISPTNCVIVYTYTMTEEVTGSSVVNIFNGPT